MELELGRSLALFAAWCISEDDDARADRRRRPPSPLRRRSRRRLRAVDPGARRHRLHVGARAPPALQARALDPVLGGVRGPASRRGSCPPARRRRRRQELRCKGLMMDYQLNAGDDPAARRGAVRPQDRHEPAARQELAPLHLRRLRPPREAARARAARRARPRATATASPRSPGTTTSTSRPTSGSPMRRVRLAHAQPAASPRRPHLHRDARRRSRPDRRQDAAGRCSSSSATASRSST